MEQPVLILGAEPRIVIPIARSLHRHGIDVDVAGLPGGGTPVPSRAIRRYLSLPTEHRSGDAFVEALCARIHQARYDMVIPSSDTALALVAPYDERLRALVHLCCPPPHVVNRVLQKDLTVEYARRCGIAVPATHTVSSAADLSTLRGGLTFPLVAKARAKSPQGSSGFKARYFHSFEELQQALRQNPELGVENLLQEYCPGVGIGVGMLVHGGELIAAFQHRRLKELPATGGVSVVAISEPLDPALKQAALALLQALEWEGPAMVEFRHNPADSTSALMEVNGRYWGTSGLALQSGVDFPLYQWQLAHGQTPSPPARYREGTRWRWTSGCLLQAQQIVAEPRKHAVPDPVLPRNELVSVLDFGPGTRSALWSRADPRPEVIEVSQTLRKIAAEGMKGLARRVLPAELTRHLCRYRLLEPAVRFRYAQLQVYRALRLRRDDPGRISPTPRSVLFVCHGNVLRSPMAAALFRHYFAGPGADDLTIESAGLHAKPGRPADERGILVAREFGISLEEHRAQPVTRDLVAAADTIFVMDSINEAVLIARYPGARRKVIMLGGRFRGEAHRDIEIADPYHGEISDVRRCYARLDERIRKLSTAWRPRDCVRAGRSLST